ncbi:hypothetical protein MKUB_32730 [Mycobacterium kubicae]|uniref:Uncharacterized protein n=1 Tax=Mycobacterium kubicae TaxID=120959 RepID=A0AAX1J8Q2_9MYCO|nr:hypothetical protein [Mycobacterium kubicae]MCV7095301.1 hypothetical protein [Mycobacterium kubicae]QNI14370.1 hypothetical protein GAN18_27780 [Mycobacterium kubicae]QPI37893.1 hypothetical protein I2456_27245 [Mycobacterium kubicae]GFG65783.1 hypothetical protein MKUB_32730 [Mycobacterium kubicae]
MSEQTLVRPIWTPEDARQAARDAAGHTSYPAEPCNCESVDCRHAYMGVPAGDVRVMYVGRVCDDCAASHLAPYVANGTGQ